MRGWQSGRRVPIGGWHFLWLYNCTPACLKKGKSIYARFEPPILYHWGIHVYLRRRRNKENIRFVSHRHAVGVFRALPQVFGTNWPSNGTDYSVYKEWETDDRQLLEMVSYKGIKGLRNCSASPS